MANPKDTKPKTIFDYVCARIAEPLQELGFKHRKSKKDIYMADDNFIYRIWFQPSMKYGGSIRFIVHVSVESENGVIFATTLANLTKREQTLVWHDVTMLYERERVILEIHNQVNEFAIPFFKRFENIDLLIEEVSEYGFLPHRFKKSKVYLEQHIDNFIACFK